jgi:hypothetical protein
VDSGSKLEERHRVSGKLSVDSVPSHLRLQGSIRPAARAADRRIRNSRTGSNTHHIRCIPIRPYPRLKMDGRRRIHGSMENCGSYNMTLRHWSVGPRYHDPTEVCIVNVPQPRTFQPSRITPNISRPAYLTCLCQQMTPPQCIRTSSSDHPAYSKFCLHCVSLDACHTSLSTLIILSKPVIVSESLCVDPIPRSLSTREYSTMRM